jgi:cell shape-determining protein MreD
VLVIVSSHWLRTVEAEEETLMIAGFLLGLLADVVFESTASLRRVFGAEMDRYFDHRAFVPPVKRSAASTR